MIKLSFKYDQTSARLEVDGLPDLSINQDENHIGILSSWKLNLVGTTELEGKREHLEALMLVVLQYSRHRISGILKKFGDSSSPVSISPQANEHLIVFRSSQEGVEPLKLLLDHSELADLVRCLDQLRLDNRVKLDWNLPYEIPLTRKEISTTIPFSKRFGPSLLGLSTFIFITGLLFLIPVPDIIENNTSNTPLETKSKTK